MKWNCCSRVLLIFRLAMCVALRVGKRKLNVRPNWVEVCASLVWNWVVLGRVWQAKLIFFWDIPSLSSKWLYVVLFLFIGTDLYDVLLRSCLFYTCYGSILYSLFLYLDPFCYNGPKNVQKLFFDYSLISNFLPISWIYFQ